MRMLAMALAVAGAVGLGLSFTPAASAETVKKVVIKKDGDRGMHRGRRSTRVVVRHDRGLHRGWRYNRGHHYGWRNDRGRHYGARHRSGRTVVKKVIRHD